jgi:hypothetical protein
LSNYAHDELEGKRKKKIKGECPMAIEGESKSFEGS